ncbi:hypothetical protein [Synechococcus sp. ROS8604]|uniref:hypothetical protein n=1 Tax=Synechococcus sp. ROS8604 TaxID=1442557 RepID=UPI0016484BD8|nr:hypothetical protein [Synechococcus sp. ROS8604]
MALDRAVYWFRPPAEQRDIQVLSVPAGKTTSAACWCGCCKTALRPEPALSTQ